LKPWLLNILACPIDKHHPLDAYIFSWMSETGNETSSHVPPEHIKILAKQINEGIISPPSIKAVKDLSGSIEAKKLLQHCLDILNKQNPDSKDLAIVNQYLNLFDIAEGLLVCPKCGRWYPIGNSVESIPELMPDELREREKELNWLERWRGKIPEAVLSSGMPFKP